MKNCLYIIALLIIAQFSFGQKKYYGQNFSLISKAYSDAKNFSSEVMVYSYKDRDQQKGDLLGVGIIRKSEKKYYSRFLGEVLIANDHCAVMIDSLDRQITYFGEARGQIRDPFSMDKIDSLMRRQDSVVDKGIQDGLQHYVFYNRKGVIVRVDMYVNVKDNFIKRLTYYYGTANKNENYDMYKMDIFYNNIRLDKVNDSYFSEKGVVSYKNGTPYLQNAYHSYKLKIADKYQPPKQ